MKKLIAGAVATVVSLIGLAACQPDAGTPGTAGTPDGGGSGKIQISMIGKTTDDHFALIKAGALAAGEALGAEVTYNAPDSSNEGDRQLNMLQTALNNKPDAVGIAPQDGIQDGAPTILEQHSDIPFVIFDTPLPGSDVPIATISSNNKGIGAHVAEEMSKVLGGTGKVALITNGILGTAAERRDGFTEWLAANAPGIEVVDIQDGEADPAKSRDKAQALLQAHPDLGAMVGTGNYSTIAIADEIIARGSNAKAFGMDADPDVLTLMREGKVAGIVAQNPYDMGYQTVEMLVAATKGEKPAEKLVYTDSVFVTPDNLDDPEIKKTLGLE
ncbi:MAG: substrate-binding domain-containing protein [Tessaracoccus sp.]|uniref:substrate-binding domain-containing protein n=1 Tax=Tessaracoccus sp. TaxID=1971211 RepID=UPI001ED33C0D|nr:substrate-binding domain-containing protein [Tessaracoccus sp.]MBK7819774.1 substrate-binding domain-containing protein [Tessaracoccus sp.]